MEEMEVPAKTSRRGVRISLLSTLNCGADSDAAEAIATAVSVHRSGVLLCERRVSFLPGASATPWRAVSIAQAYAARRSGRLMPFGSRKFERKENAAQRPHGEATGFWNPPWRLPIPAFTT